VGESPKCCLVSYTTECNARYHLAQNPQHMEWEKKGVRCPLWLPAGICRVPCVRDERALTDLSAAEMKFQDLLCRLLQPEMTPDCICGIVILLNGMVQEGLVAHRRAAALCNVLGCRQVSTPQYVHVGLLWAVLYSQHLPGCKCLAQVLAWGICPHVVSQYRQGIVSTVMGRNLQASAVQDLLMYGALPWYRLSDKDEPVGSDIEFLQRDFPYFSHHGVAVAALRLHWRRWHARLRKRQWVMLAASA